MFSLYPLTQEEISPKALLSVANKPMISHTIDWLEKAGIADLIVIAQKNTQKSFITFIYWVTEY